MPDVYKGKPYMTEEYFERREAPNEITGAPVPWDQAGEASEAALQQDAPMLREILAELEAP